MQDTQIILLAFMIGAISILTPSCHAKDKYPSGGPYYFESFAGYKIPFQPVGELTAEKAKIHGSYYTAYFDGQGKIVLFEKYLSNKKEFSDHYFYKTDGVLDYRKLTKASGETIIQYFDEKGNLIKKGG